MLAGATASDFRSAITYVHALDVNDPKPLIYTPSVLPAYRGSGSAQEDKPASQTQCAWINIESNFNHERTWAVAGCSLLVTYPAPARNAYG